uniref:Exoribonuclease phosphorolytic domain-containing protein n=1 Tax=Ictidomys tridecemlineatus TaxID=43179 RepID=A0A287CVS4_ICTTR
MAGLGLLSDQGYRVDGRRAAELRKIQARRGVFAQTDGSAYVDGLLAARGERAIRVPVLPDRALVNCQYSSATFSTGERKRRPHGGCKTCEMGLQLLCDGRVGCWDTHAGLCACSAGFVEDTALGDLSHMEEAAGGPQLALALLPASGRIALFKMDARLHEDHL